MIDLYELPINLVGGQEQANLSGLRLVRPPRRTARGRGADIFITLATFLDGATPEPEIIEEALQVLDSTYFSEPGSATSGLRAAAAALNNYLLDFNAQGNNQALALLNLAVLRKDVLYLAHAGPTYSFVLDQGQSEDYVEPYIKPQALGLTQTVKLAFFQSQVKPGSLLVMCPRLPENWQHDLLTSAAQLSLGNLRRRLMQRYEDNFQAGLVQFQEGDGTIHRLRRRTSSQAASPGRETAARRDKPVSAEKPQQPGTGESVSTETGEQVPSPEPMAASQSPPPPLKPPAGTQGQTRISPEAASLGQEEPQPKAKWDIRSRLPKNLDLKKGMRAIRRRIAETWQSWRQTRQNISQKWKDYIVRLLPGTAKQQPRLPSTTLLFIAVAVPVVIVAAATTAYLRSGLDEEHRRYLEQAEVYAVKAQNQEELSLQRINWEQTLTWLEKAEEYTVSEESTILKRQARLALDEMDGIVRLDARPASSTPLADHIQISKIVSVDDNLYLLDSSEGRILRLFLAGKEYKVDTEFKCGTGPAGSIYINSLIDLVALPLHNSLNAALLAIDDSGNLLYCTPGEEPVSRTLAPPDAGWGEIRSISQQYNILYVMDVADDMTNAVWVYYDEEDKGFDSTPYMYFDTYIPYLADVVDIAVNDEEFYLLHEDGKMTICSSNMYFLDVSCTDPVVYGDMRPERDPQPVIFAEAGFIQAQSTRPPDPSLYLLDANETSVYHLSFRLNLQRQFRFRAIEGYTLPEGPPTAFVITSGRLLVMAFDNQVYLAYLP